LISNILENTCGKLLTIIEECYQGNNKKYRYTIEQYKPVKYSVWMKKKTTTKSSVNKENDTPEVCKKRQVISAILEAFLKAKRIFTDEDKKNTLIHFYRRNQDNLRGVFESTIEIIFEKSSANISIKEKEDCISENPTIANFWMNTSTQYYLQFLTKLLAAGIFVRKTFFNFIHELEDETYSEKIEKVNIKITPLFTNGIFNKEA